MSVLTANCKTLLDYECNYKLLILHDNKKNSQVIVAQHLEISYKAILL